MSLRNKIIWLFVGLAVIPILTLATFSYWHSRKLVERTVQSTLSESIQVLQEQVQATLLEKEEAVDKGAEAIEAWGIGTGLAAGGRAATVLSAISNQFEYVRVEGTAGRPVMEIGTPPADRFRCMDGVASRLMRIGRRIPGADASLEAGYWASDLVGRGSISTSQLLLISDAPDGAVLYMGGCEAGDESLPPWAEEALASVSGKATAGGQLAYSEGGNQFLGAFLRFPQVPWVMIMAASPAPVLLPLGRLHYYYWVFVLVLTVTTVAAFSMLIGPVTRSLRELTRAAEKIGAGELDPWLPPPSGGEIGQLTVAVSRMAERLREMMVQVERHGRLAVVGQLSAYLAHEIRNPLSSVKLNLQRIQRWARAGRIPDIATEPVEISLKEVDRLANAVNGVLQLSRSQDGETEKVSLHQILLEAKSLLLERFRAQAVEIDMALDAGADMVIARPGQLKSAILNLMVNALEAQPTGGSLLVHSELVRRDPGEGPWIVLRFEDRGSGVPDEIRNRIFDPFFTTKRTGSGIGLAVALQCVEENGGYLHLEHAETGGEAGACFVVSLPLAPVDGTEPYGRSAHRVDWIKTPRQWRFRNSPAGEGRGELLGRGADGRTTDEDLGLDTDSSYSFKEVN